jgi:hypothetical protein
MNPFNQSKQPQTVAAAPPEPDEAAELIKKVLQNERITKVDPDAFKLLKSFAVVELAKQSKHSVTHQ